MTVWNHCKVFAALVDKGFKRKLSPRERPFYVAIYSPQETNAAILYDEGEKGPLHINHLRTSGDFFEQIKPYITQVGTDKGKGKNNFQHYCVNDWDAFARVIGL